MGSYHRSLVSENPPRSETMMAPLAEVTGWQPNIRPDRSCHFQMSE
jgi:hypothetical protein